MMRSLKAIVAGVLLMASPLQAEELRIINLEDGDVILFAGDVIEGSAKRLDDLLTANPTIKRVGMVSGGGMAVEGFNLADVLSKHDVIAIVPRGYACLSACAIGFIGAKEYVILGVLGFHNMYIPDESMTEIDKLTLILRGQWFGVMSTIFFVNNGFEVELPYIISVFTDPETFVVFTNTEDLLTFFARNEEDDVSSYLSGNNEIDEVWIEEHVWDTQKFMDYLQRGENNAP